MTKNVVSTNKLNQIRVNAHTQWGKLKVAFVGTADNACYQPAQPGHQPVVNSKPEQTWPSGPKPQKTIDLANAELNNLAAVLAQHGVQVLRPSQGNWHKPLATPDWSVDNQYCATCPRDIVITVGNRIIEAALSRRDRYFEINAYRQQIFKIWSQDPNSQWIAAPKATMHESMYDQSWWQLSTEQRYLNMHNYQYCLQNDEIMFDAADITRCGKDIFVQLSMTTNQAAINWLRRTLKADGVRVHTIKFPYDLAPSHIDCTFVVLAPHLVLTNPDRPIAEEDKALWIKNGWKLIDAVAPDNPQRPLFSQSSKWLSMNVLVIDHYKVIVEQQEVSLQRQLRQLGFTVIAVPFRHVYEFGGGLHCSTWDIEREDSMIDLFPMQA